MTNQAAIHEMASHAWSSERIKAADALSSTFAHLPDKIQGWWDLLRLIKDRDIYVQRSAADAIGIAFSHLPNKIQGWNDLLRFTQDQDSDVQSEAVIALGLVYSDLPDKTQGWCDLVRLTQDQDGYVRWRAAVSLGSAFADLPDKTRGWKDLLRLTKDPDSFVRSGVSDIIDLVLPYLPNKTQGWKDLLRLTQDLDSFVKRGVVNAISPAFACLPNKAQGWQDLHKLTHHQDSDLRSAAAEILGSAFADLADKTQAWQDLLRLTQDQDSYVRMYAYHSLGRASIQKALEADEKNTIKSELQAAVEFFESSSQESSLFNPANFCLPFYRSYLALTFQDASNAEVQKYLAEAKDAIGSSENKKELFGAVENLARALEETQKIKEKSKENIQSDLKAYQWYCDKAAVHMAAAEDSAPGAVKLLRKCNPIIEERIETTIAEIQKTAREICKATRGSGTKYEASGAEINREAKSLSSEDPIKAFKSSTRIATILREFCGLLPRDKRGHACEIVDEIEAEQELSGRLCKIELALTYLQLNIDMAAHESGTRNKLEEMHIDIKSMDKKLNMIIFDLSKIKIGSGDIVANLWAVRTELNKIAEMEKSSALNFESISEHSSTPNEEQIELGNLIEAKVLDLEEILKMKATKEDSQAILNKLESLKPSAGFEWMGRIADVIAIFDASIKIIQLL